MRTAHTIFVGKPEGTEQLGNMSVVWNTGLLKKKYTLPKIYFTKTTDAKSMSCVWTERKSLKVLISMI
jgi:hypothetical protein